MKSFTESSYLAQVRRLRQMAENSLEKFPVKNFELEFIHHGENATFKVTTKKQAYLLRLHRNDYHTKAALSEELKWLKSLGETSDISVQKPVLSKAGNLLVQQTSPVAPARYCSLLSWQPGRIRYKNLTCNNFYEVGLLTAQLHKSAGRRKTKHRNYWDTEGLVGRDGKFGSLLNVKNHISLKDFSHLEKCRKMVYSKILKYQKKNPQKLSLIHADLHFGNMLWNKGEILPIDFDDCGFGFHLYDLAVTLYSSSVIFKNQGRKKAKLSTQSFLNGYTEQGHLSDEDLELIPYFILARKLAMVGWLNERRDNPRLLNYFNKSIKERIGVFKKATIHGPAHIL